MLIIDEISMVENLFFERLNAVLKEGRENDEAFGGIQLIVTGDVSMCYTRENRHANAGIVLPTVAG